jgi:pilus assembly protein CpaF
MSLDNDLVRRVRHRLGHVGGPPSQHQVIDAVRAEPGHAVLGDATLLRLGGQLYEEIAGAGPLTELLADPSVTDITVNGPAEVWIDRGAGLERAGVRFADATTLRLFAQRLAAACDRRLDDASPYVDARLPDGTRLHAVLPPIAVSGPYLSLRTFRQQALELDDLVRAGTLTPVSALLVDVIVRARLAYVVTGGTGTGKTTLLGALLGRVPAGERIVIVEDASELRPRHPHVVSLESRLSNVEGSGAVGLRDLVRQALRMRPDRLVVGECRGPEVVDLLGALNTGHEGGACTLHANTAEDVPARFEALGLLGGLTREALHAQLAAGLQIVLQLARVPAPGGTVRALTAVSVLLGDSRSGVRAVPAWRRDTGLGRETGATALAALLAARGVPLPAVLGAFA